ncbi:MAG TPA: YfhO family protein [Ignavibacteriaceae bacterium]|nr:YfhO family protein [Ignavibacteriaceae bacterium]
MAAKEKKTAKTNKKSNDTFLSNFSLDKIIPNKFQTLFLLLIILVIFLLFYSPLYFGGKTFQSGDIITAESSKTYVENHQGGYTLWNPYIFTGMPAYALATGYKWFNLIYVVVNTVRNIFSAPFNIDYAKWTFYLLALAYTMFFFMISRTKNRMVSLFTSLVTSFSTGIVVFLYIGHVTKLTAIWVFPVLLLLLLNFQKKIKLLDVMLLLFFMPVMFLGWHVQIIFYIFFAVMIYFIYYLLRAIKIKDNFLLKQLLKSAAIFLVAVIIGLGIQSDNFTQVWEYSPYSTRGTESVVDKQSGNTKKTETDFYDYATNWSFSPGEVLTWIVPSYYGFGKSVYNGPLSQNQDVEVNTYFGQMPFVDVAMYMGVIVFFLAIFSMIINWKDPLVRYLTILAAIATLISFGRTFPLFYDLMFHYFPFFDKFRVPSMILILVQLSFPILAGLGIAKLISLKNENDKKFDNLVKNIFLGLTIIFILTLLLASPIKSWFIGRIMESGEKGNQLQQLHDYMAEMFLTDARLAFFFSAAVFGLMFAYLKSFVSRDLMITAIIVLSLIDIFRINHRGETLKENTDIQQLFQKPEYVSAIEKLNDKSTFRILNLKQDGSLGSAQQNSNYNAYFLLQDLYGYSGIKPRAYQDYMDVLGSPANPTLWRMTNTKYIILDKPINFPGLVPVYSGNKTYVYENQNALPRAYFVDTVQKASAIEILNKVKNNQFDPKKIAFVEDAEIKVDKPDSTASVQIEKYGDENIYLNVNATGNNFLFLGDTYVGKGWKAYVDGNETPIYRTNHNFRGVIVPKGNHKIHFEYLPKSFVITKNVSLVLSSLVVLGLLFAVGMNFRKKKEVTE